MTETCILTKATLIDLLILGFTVNSIVVVSTASLPHPLFIATDCICY